MVSRDCRDRRGEKDRPDREARKGHPDRRGRKDHRAETALMAKMASPEHKVRKGHRDRKGHRGCEDSTVRTHRFALHTSGTFTSSATRKASSKTFKPCQLNKGVF